MNGFALRVALTRRQKGTRKWPFDICPFVEPNSSWKIICSHVCISLDPCFFSYFGGSLYLLAPFLNSFQSVIETPVRVLCLSYLNEEALGVVICLMGQWKEDPLSSAVVLGLNDSSGLVVHFLLSCLFVFSVFCPITAIKLKQTSLIFHSESSSRPLRLVTNSLLKR